MIPGDTDGVKNTFDAVCTMDGRVQVVKIREVDMGGWTLFECYLLFSGEVLYFSQEEEGAPLEHIDMEDEVPGEWAASLIGAIRERRAA